jgi:hypothetical protein
LRGDAKARSMGGLMRRHYVRSQGI